MRGRRLDTVIRADHAGPEQIGRIVGCGGPAGPTAQHHRGQVAQQSNTDHPSDQSAIAPEASHEIEDIEPDSCEFNAAAMPFEHCVGRVLKKSQGSCARADLE